MYTIIGIDVTGLVAVASAPRTSRPVNRLRVPPVRLSRYRGAARCRSLTGPAAAAECGTGRRRRIPVSQVAYRCARARHICTLDDDSGASGRAFGDSRRRLSASVVINKELVRRDVTIVALELLRWCRQPLSRRRVHRDLCIRSCAEWGDVSGVGPWSTRPRPHSSLTSVNVWHEVFFFVPHPVSRTGTQSRRLHRPRSSPGTERARSHRAPPTLQRRLRRSRGDRSAVVRRELQLPWPVQRNRQR